MKRPVLFLLVLVGIMAASVGVISASAGTSTVARRSHDPLTRTPRMPRRLPTSGSPSTACSASTPRSR